MESALIVLFLSKDLQALHTPIYHADIRNRGTRASGVEYINDIISNPESDQTPIIAKASKLVIVAAGTFGSPAILERSGIGAKTILDKFNLVDLPGVGQNYHGEYAIMKVFRATYLCSRSQRPFCLIPCRRWSGDP